MDLDYKKLLLTALSASLKSGSEILSIYNSDFKIENKEDNSPLTLADKKSHEIIAQYLKNNSPGIDIPILSEEGKNIPYEVRKHWDYFWLVDPLDGTKEFIKHNGEYTVNIALIHQFKPVLGIVYIPINNTIYYSADNIGAYKLVISKDSQSEFEAVLSVSDFNAILNISEKLPLKNRDNNSRSGLVIVASRSHLNKDTEKFINSLRMQYNSINIIQAGSSLKLCLVAEGKADIYPRLGPTMEWDTAAAHAVVNGAGKKVMNYEGDGEISYNKPNLRNSWFVGK